MLSSVFILNLQGMVHTSPQQCTEATYNFLCINTADSAGPEGKTKELEMVAGQERGDNEEEK